MATLHACSPSQGEVRRRLPSVAGQFYSSDADTLRREVDELLRAAQARGGDDVRAVISPHAGYVFSGGIAAEAFARISPHAAYERVFLIGPSHRAHIGGASVEGEYSAYTTPLGDIAVDTATCAALRQADSAFVYMPQAHEGEHCLEVQLPFLQVRLGRVPPIVPIIVDAHDLGLLRRMADVLRPWFCEGNLFVISSDFSHYPDYDDAVRADSATGAAIATGSLDAFVAALGDNGAEHMPGLLTSACGQAPIAMLLAMVQGAGGVRMEHLAYANSGDSPYGDHHRVVGYHAFAAVAADGASTFALTAVETLTLLRLARRSIERGLQGYTAIDCDSSALTETLRRPCGAFVTLTQGGRLRGCIGSMVGSRPLYATVWRMAQEAAMDDPRFPPLRRDELQGISIEVSVLSPLRRIESASEIEIGRHGVLMVANGRSGTYLPKVAVEQGWTKEELLGHCARDKAGIGWDGWRGAELYVYEAEVFGEDDGM